MKDNREASASLKALASEVLAGNQAGNRKATILENLATFEATSGQKLPKKVAYSVTRFDLNEHCQGCPYHDTGPDTFGTSIIHWCGPFKEPGYIRWLNIAELTACPLGKCGILKF